MTQTQKYVLIGAASLAALWIVDSTINSTESAIGTTGVAIGGAALGALAVYLFLL